MKHKIALNLFFYDHLDKSYFDKFTQMTFFIITQIIFRNMHDNFL